jgi:poly-gamma-glutamate synthesis protein (capsule biosynthesis protein)
MVTLALCGDVMLGRGIDQILPHPEDPELHEGYVRSARTYVELAERINGPIPRPVGFPYVWGDALAEMRKASARIVNLETSVTTSRAYEPKGINYRMHPQNIETLRAACIDCCVLANNHVLDWGQAGLLETLNALREAGIKTAGAGCDLEHAGAPAVIDLEPGHRILVFAFGSGTSGIPETWAAGPGQPGVHLIEDFSAKTVARIAGLTRAEKRPGDIAVASIHWGENWGYEVPHEFRDFAHALIGEAAIDLIHGHSSHHAKGIEIYRDRLILYGAGDFLNDYEGIEGYEAFRGDLTVLYLPDISPRTGELTGLRLVPFRIQRFRLTRPTEDDLRWLCERLDRESRASGVRVETGAGGGLDVLWHQGT